MLQLTPEEIIALPVDELALQVLGDFSVGRGWNEHNYLLEVNQHYRGASPTAMRAIAEAFSWAKSQALIARSPDQSSSDAVFVTRLGEQALKRSLSTTRALIRLGGGLHPGVEQRARRQFLLGEAEQAVFVAMKAVEIRVRDLARLTDADFGASLMNRAFGPGGSLTDPSATSGEQDGTRALFVGAYQVLRNPSGHREVDYADIAEATEAVAVASLLMRILDRIEERLLTLVP